MSNKLNPNSNIEHAYILELDFIYKHITNLSDTVFRNKNDIIAFINKQIKYHFEKNLATMKLKISNTNLYLKNNELDIDLFNKIFDHHEVATIKIINNFNVEPILIIKKLVLK